MTHVQLAELRAWDKGLSTHAALIHHYRETIFEAWQPYFSESIAQLLPAYAEQLSLSYNVGYDTSIALDIQLNERLEQDLQLGYTRIGNHRADIHVHWRSIALEQRATDKKNASFEVNESTKLPVLKEQAANILSRGEKKLLITALRLSQLPLLLNVKNNSDLASSDAKLRATPVVLLDDITAELDERAIEILLATLAQLPCQVFMSSLSESILPMINEYWSEPKVFHMKRGEISLTQ